MFRQHDPIRPPPQKRLSTNQLFWPACVRAGINSSAILQLMPVKKKGGGERKKKPSQLTAPRKDEGTLLSTLQHSSQDDSILSAKLIRIAPETSSF
jgi:hypothetical protein